MNKTVCVRLSEETIAMLRAIQDEMDMKYYNEENHTQSQAIRAAIRTAYETIGEH